MSNSYWKNKWNTNDIKFHQEQVDIYLQNYYEQFISTPDTVIFLPLCGKSLDILWLREKGHTVIGVELSDIACVSFFTENALSYSIKQYKSFKVYMSDKIIIYCGDFFKLSFDMLNNIQNIYDRGGFIALRPEIRYRYVTHLADLTPANTKLLLSTFEYNIQKEIGPPFSATYSDIKKLYARHFTIEKLEESNYNVPEHFRQKGVDRVLHTLYLLQKH